MTDAPNRRGWPWWIPVAVLVVGLVVTGVLALVSAHLYTNNEKRLLVLRGKELGAVLAQALPNTQVPLASAAALADATNGNPQKVKRFIAPYVGAPPKHQFVSASLWRAGGTGRTPLLALGLPPALTSSSSQFTALLDRAVRTHKLSVAGILNSSHPRLGYAFSTSGPRGYVVYSESMLPANRRSRLESNQAFSEINYAIYLGHTPANQKLLVTSLKRLPVQGSHSMVRIPFGDTVLTLVVAARQPLAGSLPERLPWIILIAGALLATGAALLTARLQRAVEENRRLYAQQRTIAQTLQHALLPAELPELPGLQVGARYEAGAEGVEIGGDWYDLIQLEDRKLLLVVGDVSGRGLPAATAMAALRFAIHAYAAQGDDPTTLLTKLSQILTLSEDEHLATVLCALIDADTRQISLVSAGHLPPLLITPTGSEFLEAPIGVPVGVDRDPAYSATTFTAPPGATLLAFTDGLVERRGESIEDGLERLRAQVSSNHVPLEELLTRVLAELRHDAPDDAAIAGIRWMT
jgi:hypothetical protein